jgi:hypothetical protein
MIGRGCLHITSQAASARLCRVRADDAYPDSNAIPAYPFERALSAGPGGRVGRRGDALGALRL